MGNVKEKLAAILRCGFLPILTDDALDPLFLAGICRKLGIPAIEYTLRRQDIRQILPKLKEQFPELTVLAASTIDNKRLVSFLKGKRDFSNFEELYHLGVDGVVSVLPFQQQTYQEYREKWLFIPGVETVAEAFQQLDWGAHLIKFFNAEAFGGPMRIKMLQVPTYSVLPILVTGGMLPEKVGHYLESGVLVVTAGFDLILANRYRQTQENPDNAFIRKRLTEYLNAIANARARLGQAHWAEIEDADRLLEATGKCFPFGGS